MDLSSVSLRLWRPAQSTLVVLLVVFCAFKLAQISWYFLDTPAPIDADPVRPAPPVGSVDAVNWTALARDISQREYFGEIVAAETEVPVVAADAPETRLNLVLQAIAAEGAGAGYALISQRGQSAQVFTVGDDLFDQASLSAVYGDRVIIERRGALETLRYEKLRSASLQPVEAPAAADVSLTEAGNFREALEQANDAVAEGGDVADSVRGMVDYVSQRASEDPEALIREVGLTQVEGGYEVSRRARQLQMVGLRPGDIVTSINDTPVGNIQSDQLLLNQILQTGGELKIQIRRGSRSFTIYQSIPAY